MNQNSIDESNDFGDADDWMMAMRRLSEQLLYGLESLTAKPDAQSSTTSCSSRRSRAA